MGFFSSAAEALTRAVAPRPSALRASAPPSSSSYRRRRTRYGRNEAIDATPSTVVSIFSNAASTGDTSRQVQFFKDCRVLDSRLDQLAAKRAGAPAGLPLTFRAPPGRETDPVAIENAQMCGRLWNATRRTRDAITHLNHGPLEGHAFLAQKWILDSDTGWLRPEFQIEASHSAHIAWNLDTLEPWFIANPGRTVNAGTEITDECFPLSSRSDDFLFYAPLAGRADDPWRRGVLRACVIRSLIKRATIGHWMHLLERWGQPQVYAEVDADVLGSNNTNDSSDVETEVDDALIALGRDWHAQVPKGVTFKEIPVSVASDLHKNFVEWAQTEDAIAVLGQNLTTESSGSGHAGVIGHRRVEHEIVVMDASGLDECITDGWCSSVIRRNRPGTPVPFAAFVTSPKQVVTVADYQARAYTTDEFRVSRGDEPEANGKGARLWEPPVGHGGLVGTPATDEPSKASDTGVPGASQPEQEQGPGLASMPAPAAPEKPEALPDAIGDAPVEKAADAALNGAQIDALKGIINDVAQGLIPRETGIALITAGFPIDAATAEKIMGTVGNGFVPRDPKAPAPAAPPSM